MTDTFIKFLEYGVIGLCMATLIIVWKIIQTEQHRDSAPRKPILTAAYVFMLFSLSLAAINTYIQLTENGHINNNKLIHSTHETVVLQPFARGEVTLKCPKDTKAYPAGIYTDSNFPVEFSILKDGMWTIDLSNKFDQINKVTVKLICQQY